MVEVARFVVIPRRLLGPPSPEGVAELRLGRVAYRRALPAHPHFKTQCPRRRKAIQPCP